MFQCKIRNKIYKIKLTSPKLRRLACFRNSVIAYRSFILRTRFPPRFFLLISIGFGRGFANLTGGGSCNLSNFFSISSLNCSPISPLKLWWLASTRAAKAHLAATKRAAFRRRSCLKRNFTILDKTCVSAENKTIFWTYRWCVLYDGRIKNETSVW